MAQSAADSTLNREEHRPRWKRTVGFLVATATMVVVTIVAIANWSEWQSLLTDAKWQALLGALATAVAGQFLNATIAHRSLRVRGTELRLGTVYRINAVGGLAKFIPGGVWQIGSQYGLGRAAGLNFRRSMLAWVEPTAFNVTVGAGLAMLAAVTVDYGIPSLLLIPGGIAALIASTNPVRNRLYRLIRLVPTHEGRTDPMAGWPSSFATTVAIIALTGIGGVLVIEAFGLQPSPGLFGSVAAFVGAWVVGVLVFPIPGGLGVREGALVLALSPWMSSPQAVLVAAASRLIAVAAELVAAVVASMVGPDDAVSVPTSAAFGRGSSMRKGSTGP